ncbi:MAG: ASKHA domain-containing protein, partial [Eubacteriales bacterium]
MSEKRIHIPPQAEGMQLSDYLAGIGEDIHTDCGGLGICQKCRVRLLSGSFGGVTADSAGMILSCKAVCTGKSAEIALLTEGETQLSDSPEKDLLPHEKSEDSEDREGSRTYGLALDIGTTTLAMALVDLHTGQIVDTRSRLNPQRSFGADVMNRISAADRGHLGTLQKLVCEAVSRMIVELIDGKTEPPIGKMTVAGNPTMLHLFCGISPSGMGKYPFTPAFTELRELSGAELGVPVERVVVLPSASAFIGSDITAGLLVTDPTDRPSVLMDLGTNGEMVLRTKGKAVACSTAAGPALEGAGITCGMGGVRGAICRVDAAGGHLSCKTVGDAPPAGICGSGLIDLAAHLLELSVIDEEGFMDRDFTLAEKDGQPTVYLTPKDVRELQLAKSAIRSGLEALVDAAGLRLSDIGTLWLAGGLGYYLNPYTASLIGLIPPMLAGRVRPVGNTSLIGAVECLTSKKSLGEISCIAGSIRTIDLNESKVFQEGFI